MSNKNIAKLMELKGLTEDEVRCDLASKKSLKDNINDYLDEKNEWINFTDLLRVSKRYNFNKGGEITERGLKIMLARMRDTADIFRSDNSGYWWSTVTSDATTFPVTAIPADWKPTKKVNKPTTSLGVRGKRATSAEKFYNTVLNSLLRGDNVPEKTVEMARLEYANCLSIQFGGKVTLEDIQRWLKFGESNKLNPKDSTTLILSEEDNQEIDELLSNAALLESEDDDSEVEDDNGDSE